MKNKKNVRSKILENATPSYDWINRPDYKTENQEWILKSVQIAVSILDALEEKKMTQSDLADKLGVSRQQVNKIVNGHENLTLQTISKIEEVLGVKLIEVLDIETESKSVAKPKPLKAPVRKSA
ncbi:MAG: helix-turn-helix transcriptional regulator [Bacteroidota bacterium]